MKPLPFISSRGFTTSVLPLTSISMSNTRSEVRVWLLYWSDDAGEGGMRHVYRTRKAAVEAVTSIVGCKTSEYEAQVTVVGWGMEELEWDAPHREGQRESRRSILLMPKPLNTRSAVGKPQTVQGDIDAATEVFIVGERETGLRRSRLRKSGNLVVWEKAEMVVAVFLREERALARLDAMCGNCEWLLREGPSHVSFCDRCPFSQSSL